MTGEIIAWIIIAVWFLIPLYMAYVEIVPWRDPQLESSERALKAYIRDE